jgi:integrase/recombinase XerD
MTLRQVITQYVSFRQSMGTDFKSAQSVLNTFCRLMGEDMDIRKVRKDQVDAFLKGSGPLTRYWHRKHSVLLGFYQYAMSRGQVSDSPLPAVVPKQPQSLVPHIYTRDELHRLLEGTNSFQKQRGKLEPFTLRALLLLLYGAGLRPCEALALDVSDVDISAAVITIRKTKFYKTRLVPLGAELNQAMTQYLARRKEKYSRPEKGRAFFVGQTGARLSGNAVRKAFARLRTHAGVRRTDGARYQPRLNDFRHAFAVHRLTAWYREGADVQKLLPQLSAYLGHINVTATQVYLTMTPELLQQASERFEQYALKGGPHD